MKKAILWLLLTALTLSCLSGCGAPPANQNKLPTTPVQDTPAVEQPPAPLEKPAYTVAPELLATNSYTLQRYILGSGFWIGGQSSILSGSTLYYRAEAGDETLITGVYAADLTSGKSQLLTNYPPALETEPSGIWRTLAGFFPGDDGTVWILETITEYHYDLPADFNAATENRWDYLKSQTRTQTLRNLDAQGEELGGFDLSSPLQNFRSGAVMGDLLLLADLNQLYLYQISTGRNLAVFPTELNLICVVSDNTGLAAIAQNENSMTSLIRLDSDALVTLPAEPLALPAYAVDSVAALPGGGCITAAQGALHFACQGNPFALQRKSGTVKKLAEWVDYGVNPVYIATQSVAEDGTIAAIYHRGDQTAPLELLILSPSTEPAADAALTLGMLSATAEALDLVISHNAAEPHRRVRAVNYAEYPAFGQNPRIMIRTDIAVGHGPDLIFSPERDTPVTELAAGYLEDLHSYLKKDSQLQEEGLLQSVLKVQEKDGKLLSVAPNFWFSTAVSTTELIGTGTLTTTRASNLYHQLSTEDSSAREPFTFQESVLSEHISRNSLLYGIAENDNFNFNNQAFQEGLNYTAQFPAEIDWSKYDEHGADAGWARVRNGKQLFFTGNYYGFNTVSTDLYAVGDGAVLCGFPDVPGGHVLEIWNTYGILSAGINKPAAWSFLRNILLAEHQISSTEAGFPSNLAAFAAKGKTAMQQEGTRIMSSGETTLEVPAQLSQAQYNEILAAVEEATARYHKDYEVFAAVWPQAKAYFSGEQDLSVTVAAAQAAAQNYHNPKVALQAMP